MLTVEGEELNPRLHIEKLITSWWKREEMKGTHQWLERNESSLDAMSVKMDLMNETTEILLEEHNWIKGMVNSGRQS